MIDLVKQYPEPMEEWTWKGSVCVFQIHWDFILILDIVCLFVCFYDIWHKSIFHKALKDGIIPIYLFTFLERASISF